MATQCVPCTASEISPLTQPDDVQILSKASCTRDANHFRNYLCPTNVRMQCCMLCFPEDFSHARDETVELPAAVILWTVNRGCGWTL